VAEEPAPAMVPLYLLVSLDFYHDIIELELCREREREQITIKKEGTKMGYFV
jgi:hypothetical protein